MRFTTIGTGPIIATMIAGPVYAAIFGLFALYLKIPAPIVICPDEFSGWLALLGASVFIGPFLAVIPNFLGAVILLNIGRTHRSTRLPVVWGITGMAIAGVPLFFAGTLADDSGGVHAFVAVALVCSLVCRSTACWSKPS